MFEAAISGEASAPTETAKATVETPTELFTDQMKKWSPEQKMEWKLTGKTPDSPAAAKAPAATTETEESSVTKVKTEAAAETAEDDQELPEGDTTEARRARNQRFARMRREATEYKAKYELLERQMREKPAATTESASAPAKAKTADDNAEEFAFRDPTDTETLGEYNKAMLKAHGKWMLEQGDKRTEQRKAEETAKERDTRIQSEYRERTSTALKKREGEDTETHRTRTLQYANASRWFTGQTERANAIHIDDAILESPVGHEVILYFHGKQDEFAELLKASPARALTLLGKVEAKFEGKTPELKPVTRTSTPDPGPRVNASATAKGDPIKEAEDMHTKTGDPKYLRELNRLRNARDIAARSK